MASWGVVGYTLFSVVMGVMAVLLASPLRWILGESASEEPYNGLLGRIFLLVVAAPFLFVLAGYPYCPSVDFDVSFQVGLGVSLGLWLLFTLFDWLRLAWLAAQLNASEQREDV